MKQKYIITNIDQTVQKVMDDEGQLHWLSPGESFILTNPPAESYIFHVEELIPEVEEALKLKTTIKTFSKKELLDAIEPYVINGKYLSYREWQALGINNFDEEAQAFYDLLGTYTANKKVLSKLEFEKLKDGIELNNMEVKK